MASSLNDEQIVALLEYLFTNMNNLDRLYYDMFINTTPLMLKLERYNEDGVLETHNIPNRAMDRQSVLQGRGTPEGSVEASLGNMYFDIQNNNIYIKISEGGSYGWVLIRTSSNFIPGEDYLRPDGSAAHLRDLSTTSFDIGLLKTDVGGTGTTGLNGIIKGQGPGVPYTTAVAGIDYLTQDDFVGMLVMVPYDIDKLPPSLLPCNGAPAPINSYPQLYNRIGSKYGLSPDGLSFYLPDYRDYYLRGGVSVMDNMGVVTNTNIGEPIAPAVPNITASAQFTQEWESFGRYDYTGAFYLMDRKGNGVDGTRGNFDIVGFDASRCSSVYKQGVVDADGNPEVRVKSKRVLICIYAGSPLAGYSM